MMIDRKDKRYVSCPVCGRILMKCQGQCNIDITCGKCNRELGADKTEIEPGGILATGLIGIRFVDSFIASVSVFLLRKWRERWKRHLE